MPSFIVFSRAFRFGEKIKEKDKEQFEQFQFFLWGGGGDPVLRCYMVSRCTSVRCHVGYMIAFTGTSAREMV